MLSNYEIIENTNEIKGTNEIKEIKGTNEIDELNYYINVVTVDSEVDIDLISSGENHNELIEAYNILVHLISNCFHKAHND